MDQDKEFLQWIMQDNPLDNVDAAYRHPQPPTSQQQQQQQHPQQQYLSYPSSTMHQLSHPPHQQKQTNYSEQQRLYEERFSHQQPHSNGSNITAQSQQVEPVLPPQSYPTNGTTPPQQQMHHHQQAYYAQHHHHPYEQHQQPTHEAKSIPEGRLSDEDEEHYTDAQLKMMTSKERRQLRNKISARNFRNRRKEYIASLEGEVAKFKNENSQLRLEIKWIRTTMNKLQKENDHLRVKLALCHGGIKTGEGSVSPDQPSQEAQLQQQSSSSSSPPPATTNTMVPVSNLSPPPSGPPPSVQPSVQHAQQSHHVLPTTANANVSQKHTPSSSLNLQTQNGNPSHITPPTLNIHQQQQKQQQQHTVPTTVHAQQPPSHHHHHRHHHTSPPPPPPVAAVKQQSHSPPPAAAVHHQHPSSQPTLMNQQQQQPQKSIQQQQQQQSQNAPPNSGMSAASVFTTSPPQVMPGTIDTIHSDSSSSFTSHLSPPNFADLSDAWDLVIPNEFSSYCPPQSSMTQQTAPLFVPNMSYATQDYHHSQPTNQPHQQALVPANMSLAQQQQQQYQVSHHAQQQHNYPTNQTALYRPHNNNNNNDSYVSSAVVPDFNLENVLCKQNQVGGGLDNNLFKTYPLLVPALMSIVIGHTMSMSTDDLLSHTRLLSTPSSPQQQHPSNRRLAPTAVLHPFDGDHRQCLYFGNSKMMMMTPGLRTSQHNHRASPGPYPLSKKQVHAVWESLLDQMVKTKSKQRYRQQQQQKSTSSEGDNNDITKASKAEVRREIESEIAQEMMMTTMKWNSEHNNIGNDSSGSSSSSSNDDDYDDYYDDDEDEEPWYDMPVTGFKAICPLYWMQRQFCRFVITYVVVKYPHLEDPCKTYLPICEQFRRRAITN